jgi:outer membrane protein
MARARITHLLAALALLLQTGTTLAEDDCKTSSDECVAVGGWNFSLGLGAGDRTNPLASSKDIPLVVIPQLSYYGRRFFIDDLDVGVTLLDRHANTLSLVASPGYDRVFFYRSDLQNIFIGGFASGGTPGAAVGTGSNPPGSPTKSGVGSGNGNGTGAGTGTGATQFPSRPRHVTYLAGPEWTFEYLGVSGQLDYLHEITDQNHGDEIRAALGIPLGQLLGSWSADVGATWKSAAIVNYYYGSPGIYEAGSALNPFVKFSYARPLSKKWKLTAFIHYERLGAAISDSPIIARHYVTTGFLGATYEFHK